MDSVSCCIPWMRGVSPQHLLHRTWGDPWSFFSLDWNSASECYYSILILMRWQKKVIRQTELE